ncbi:hypothetical protein, partial [Archangium sp.]|uniref:hypothetical protein n=1 Tax=Archangium sp. TaxID=1872627 RepID=UPI00389B0C08
ELYLARHEKSGATALVLKPDAEEDPAWLKDFRVHVISSSVPSYVALEVVDSRRAKAPDRHSADALMFVLRDVRRGLRRMARAFDGPREPRRLWRLRLALVGAAAVGAVLFALVCLAFESPSPRGPEFLASTPSALMNDDVPTAGAEPDAFSNALEAPDAGEPYSFSNDLETPDAGESVLARSLPSEPFKGQKRPPCSKYSQVELVGGCWLTAEIKAPCPEDLFEHQGKCYVPIFSAKPPPQSVGE